MLTSIDTDTQVCAVIGNPVAHSLSPTMHNAAFTALGLNYVYLAFRVSDLPGCIAGLRAFIGFRGLSVTIPHKIAIMPYLDEVQPLARQVGCVNTVVNDEGVLTGAITDGAGTLRAFKQAGVILEHKQVLFVGAGGAARAVAFAIAESFPSCRLHFLGRTEARVQTLACDLAEKTEASVAFGQLQRDAAQVVPESDIIIQATPVGMHGHASGDSPVSAELLRPQHVVFDMVYRPMKTQLLLDAERLGCKTILGLEMLLHQAVLQFELWTGQQAPEDVMRRALVAALCDDAS